MARPTIVAEAQAGDGAGHAGGPAAAHGGVDAKDAGQQHHPGQPRRGSITQVSIEEGPTLSSRLRETAMSLRLGRLP